MLLLAILLLPTVSCDVRELNFVKYVVKVDEKNTLTSVQSALDKRDFELNLSSLGIEGVNTNGFDNLTEIRKVDLSNNWLSTFPEAVFSNLTSLQHLSLADNKISSTKGSFEGLSYIATVDLSNNRLEHLGESFFYDLNSKTTVHTRGNVLSNISTYLYEAPEETQEEITPEDNGQVTKQLTINEGTTNNSTVVKVCIDPKRILRLVEVLEVDEKMEEGCIEIRMNHRDLKLPMQFLHIIGFSEGWYRVKDLPVRAINFSPIRISEITREMLNDLPESVVEVDLTGIQIGQLKSEVIENRYLRSLIMDAVIMYEIEDDALANTNLTVLSLKNNYLNDTRFVASLPPSLEEIRLSGNDISEISTDVFSRLKNLVRLDLSFNNLKTIEPGFFRNFGSLRELNLYDNRINIYKGIFTGLECIEYLNIGKNQLKNITKNILFAMPDSLSTVVLDFNGIENLQAGNFVRVPKHRLSLEGNNITRIAKGSFDLPTLRELNLGNNQLKDLFGDSFTGLESLEQLSLAGNKITNLRMGLWRHLKNLKILDLSLNPIKQLNRGELHGIVKSRESAVLISGVPLEHIQGNIFHY